MNPNEIVSGRIQVLPEYESLRDKFAGLAMQALIARTTSNQSPQYVATVGYEYADAMLRARENGA